MKLSPEQTAKMIENHKQGRMAIGAVNRCAHEGNGEMWDVASEKARNLGLDIRHNTSCKVGWLGFHRYVVFIPGMNHAKGSSGVLTYEEAPFWRYWKPKASAERECIENMIRWMEDA